MEAKKIRDLAAEHNDETIPGDTDKVDMIWEAANEDMDATVAELSDELGQMASESYVREVLTDMSPGAFGL